MSSWIEKWLLCALLINLELIIQGQATGWPSFEPLAKVLEKMFLVLVPRGSSETRSRGHTLINMHNKERRCLVISKEWNTAHSLLCHH